MDIIKSSFDKRQSVQKNYDLIAEQYSNEFGTYIEDLDVYEKFEQYLVENTKILDLGAGSGRTYSYFNKQNYEYIGLDFSKKMKDYAYDLHGEFPYIVDDMVNIKRYFSNNSLDAVFAVYSLFHLPKNDFNNLFSDVYDILKVLFAPPKSPTALCSETNFASAVGNPAVAKVKNKVYTGYTT